MAANEKIRTEDVVEVLDGKILTSRAHATLSVFARENYDSVLAKISSQVLTAAQKAALDNTLSVPSAANPVVLKDDLEVYIPAADLGDIKDSVATYALLPLVGNTEGDLRAVIADGIIYRWNGSAWNPFITTGTLDHTQLTNQNGDTNFQHLTNTEKTTLISQSHSHSNLSVLGQILSAGSGQIITTAERARLPSVNEKQALAGTSGVPSGTNRYVTNQDPRLNTVRNPYVTVGPPGSLATFTGVDFGPFEDALVAVDTGTASAVKAIEVLPGFYPIGGVVLDWDVQQSSLLIEAFTPHTATLSFQTLQAGIQALLPGMGSLTVRGFIFELNDLGTSGVRSQRPNTIVENCIFRPGPTTSINQVGVILEGANSVVRRCVFEGELEKGVEIKAPNCRVEECTFNLSNPMKFGVHVMNPSINAQVDHNSFVRGRLRIEPSVQYAQISNNYFRTQSTSLTCGITVANPAVVSAINLLQNGELVQFTSTGTLPTGLTLGQYYYVRNRTPANFNVSLTPSGPLVQTTAAGSGVYTVTAVNFVLDQGYSSRYLQNLPEQINQPFVGRIRTVGPDDTYSDYRGLTEVPFLQAIQDPNVKEIHVMEGTYNFSKRITLPAGTRVKGVTQGSSVVKVVGAPGVNPFELQSDCTLENIQVEATNAHAVFVENSTNFKVERCSLSSSGTDLCVMASNCSDFYIYGNRMVGVAGIFENSTQRSRIFKNVVDTDVPHIAILCNENHIKDNIYTQTTPPSFQGDKLIIEGNHFLGDLPTKILTTNSIWHGNFPAPEANNVEGVDFVRMSIEGYFEPLTTGCVRSTIAGAGSLSFVETISASAATYPIKIPARVNTLLPFHVDILWTASASSGNVVWEVTVVYKDESAQLLGSSTAVQQVAARTGVTANNVDASTFNFTTLAYGGTVTPSHVSVTIRRLGNHVSDTMLGNAHLLGVKITIPRD